MEFEQMNSVQKRLHNAAIVLEAECDEHGFALLQLDAITEIERLTRERDEWAAKWHAERRKYAVLRWPGLNGTVHAHAV